MPTYDVLTYDLEQGEYTPQDGMTAPCEGVTLGGVKRALTELRDVWGYCVSPRESAFNVLVEVNGPDAAAVVRRSRTPY